MKALPILLLVATSLHCIAGDLTTKDAFKDFVTRKDYKGGVAAFETEIATHPTDARLFLGLGQLHYSFAKYTDAKAALEHTLLLEPANSVAHNYLGVTLSQERRAAEALKHLDLAIKSDPSYGDAHFNRAVVLATRNPPNKSAARDSYKQAISLGCEQDSALEQLLK
jgi:tetratricopeptide (TPR) repeat protein